MTQTAVPSFVMEDVTILAYEERNYTSKKSGKEVNFRTSVVRYKGKILKFRVANEVSLQDYIDQEVSLEVSLDTFGDSMEPALKILSVTE